MSDQTGSQGKFCVYCGVPTPRSAAFCPGCGAHTVAEPGAPIAVQRATELRRRRGGRWVGGVAAGLAAYWGLSVVLVRLGWLVIGLLGLLLFGVGLIFPLLAYAACWALMPQEMDHAAPGAAPNARLT